MASNTNNKYCSLGALGPAAATSAAVRELGSSLGTCAHTQVMVLHKP